MNIAELLGITEHYASQTDAIIGIIRKYPGVSRTHFNNTKVNGYRIANFTARISEARRKLMKKGETIECIEDEPIKQGRKRIRCTRYIIKPLQPCVS